MGDGATRRREGVLAFFRVQPGEGERVALMLVLSLVLVGGVVITGLIVGRSLFLSGLPASAIPLRFIVPPLLLVAATAAYSRRVAHDGRLSTVVPTFLVLAVAMVVARALLSTPIGDERIFLLLLYSLFEIAAGLSMILFWTIAGSVFDARQARRLFGLISSGSSVAMVSFGLFLGGLARRRPPESLMVIVVASLVVAALLARRLTRFVPGGDRAADSPDRHSRRRRLARRERDPHQVPREGFAESLRAAFSSPLVVTLAGIIVVISLVANLTDYQLDLALKHAYGDDGGSMIGFLSTLRLVAGVAAVVVQFLAAGRIMERFGVLAALMLLPVAVGLGSVTILVTGAALWAVATPRASVEGLRYSVNDSAFNLLYLPLAPEARTRAKAVIDGIVKPPLVAVLGLVFLVIDQFGGISVAMWSIPVLALVAAWIFLLRRAERTYVDTLAQSIALRRLDPDREQIALVDETSRRVLAAQLDHPDPVRVIHALSLLEGGTDDWTAEIIPLLGHEHPDVRASALEHLARQHSRAAAAAIRTCLDDVDPRVRAAAVRAHGSALGPRAVTELSDHLDDVDAEVRAAVVITLVQECGLAGFLHAGGPLNEMLVSDDPDQRREGARILGELGVPSFYHPLLDLVGDADLGVRRAAIDAAERTAAPELIPVLEAAAADPLVRRPAISAIVACAGPDLSVLASLLANREEPTQLRCQVARSLATCGPAALPLLMDAVDDPDPTVRRAVLRALMTLRDAEPSVHPDVESLTRTLESELRVAYDRWMSIVELRRLTVDDHLLTEALDRASTDDRDRILDLLDLIHPELQADALRDALGRGDERRRADAIELVDSVLSIDRAIVVPLLGGTDAQRADVAEKRLDLPYRTASQRLSQLCTSDEPWHRACALHAIACNDRAELRESVDLARSDPDRVVASTATATLYDLDGVERPADRKDEATMPLAPLEQVLFLKQVPLFRDLAGPDLAAMLPIVEEAEFAPGETIIREGDDGDSLFVIVEGEVAVDINGVQRPNMGPRSVIGELAILSGQPRGATCTAITEVLAMRIRRGPFHRLMSELPEVPLGVIRILIEHVDRLSSAVGNMAESS